MFKDIMIKEEQKINAQTNIQLVASNFGTIVAASCSVEGLLLYLYTTLTS